MYEIIHQTKLEQMSICYYDKFESCKVMPRGGLCSPSRIVLILCKLHTHSNMCVLKKACNT